MTKQEVKSKIDQILDTFPNDDLEEVLAYLIMLQKVSAANIKHTNSLIQVLREDKQVLQKLAQ
ncbi:MAG: hypothetical protein H6576_06800 [Lewinellaceae bacterium]|nr:hypothetical protein [Saprospiraceae bacterium]MCB9343387.1 hypothetical protein [Lewinellaceae bacterium]